MNYKAKAQDEILTPLLIGLSSSLLTLGWENTWSRVFGIIGAIIALLSVILSFLIRYSFVIEDETLTYNISLLKVSIYEKKVKRSHIKKIVFKRVGWSKKLAIIKLGKGFSIRISLFTPTTIFEDLLTFCAKNDIQIEKSKDYKILEKMY